MVSNATRGGPLCGLRIIEVKGLGPGPHAGMVLADLGADVVVVERASRPSGIAPSSRNEVTSRGKRSIALDLKHPDGLAVLLRMVREADGLFEAFRPGVAERLGFGPDDCLQVNPALVYGRLTGWGQAGPLASTAGHDINYIALAGALGAIGPAEQPAVPLNLIGDYAGGSFLLVIGMLAALLEARRSGTGQVVDAAIVDGTATLLAPVYGWLATGFWRDRRASNLLDGTAPNYTVYATADNEWLAVGALEPQFCQALIDGLDIDASVMAQIADPRQWPVARARIAGAFAERTRDEWLAVFAGSDACVAPVLSLDAASAHPHAAAREAFVEVDGLSQPAPAPRFSATPAPRPGARYAEGADTDQLLAEAGYSAADIQGLRAAGVLT